MTSTDAHDSLTAATRSARRYRRLGWAESALGTLTVVATLAAVVLGVAFVAHAWSPPVLEQGQTMGL